MLKKFANRKGGASAELMIGGRAASRNKLQFP